MVCKTYQNRNPKFDYLMIHHYLHAGPLCFLQAADIILIVVYPWLWSNIYCWPRLLDLQDMRNVTQLLLQSFFFWKEQPNNFFLIHFAMEAPAWKFSDSSSGCVLFVFIRSVVSGVYLFIKYCSLILRTSKSSEGKLKT